MSFRQRRRNGLFRVSWGTCLLLSVLAHLFLLAGSCLVPEEWLASPRPAEAARRKVAVSARMVRKWNLNWRAGDKSPRNICLPS